METAVFFYNLLLLWAFALNAAGFALLFRRDGGRVHFWLAATFFLFIADNTFSYTSEFVDDLAGRYDDILAPSTQLSMAVTLGIITCYIMVGFSLLGHRPRPRLIVGWALFCAVSCGCMPALQEQPLLLGLQNVLLELLAGTVMFYAAMGLPDDTMPVAVRGRWQGSLIVVAVCGWLSAGEYWALCFHPGAGVSSLLGVNSQRRFFLELLSVYASVVGLCYLARKMGQPGPAAESGPLQAARESSLRRQFIRRYQLTEREGQVLTLALEGKSNQAISDALFISLGTTKAHLHNIFQKTGVAGREQLRALAADPSLWAQGPSGDI